MGPGSRREFSPSGADEAEGISAEELAQATGVHLDSARRWKRLKRLPAPARRLVRLLVHGELAEISSTWSGWILRRGLLVSPEGLELAPGDLRAIPVRIAQVRALERDVELALQAIESDQELSERVRAYASLSSSLERACAELSHLVQQLPPALQDRHFSLLQQPLESERSSASTSDVPSSRPFVRAPGRAR